MYAATQQPHLLSPLTQEDLGHLKVHLPALKIVSFRGPGEAGGVASSLSPLTKQLGTKVEWVALAGVPSEEDSKIVGFSFHRPTVPESILSQQPEVTQNYLWPLFHGHPEQAHFDREEWLRFRHLSQLLADESQKIPTRSFPTLVWLHDFEMVLVPSLIPKEAGVILAHFWHTPWPAAEIFASSPVAKEIVESLLANKLIGFHTEEYLGNFLETVQLLLPAAKVEHAEDQIKLSYRGNSTFLVAMPLGLDFPYWQRLARSARVSAESLTARYRLAHQIILGVDRIDYSKGLLEKIAGLEVFLSNNPDWNRRFHYVQLAQPTGSGQKSDHYAQQVRAKVQDVNARFKSDGWEPIVWFEGDFPQSELAAWYQAADVLAVTPLRDGLNLIAKEYVACRLDEQGALVLSENAGSAYELVSGATLVDPKNPDSIAAGMLKGLTMDVEEKRRRMVSMRHVVGWNRLHDWACGFLRRAIDSSAI